MAMAMAMGAASKTTMAVTMSMPSGTRTTVRRTTSGTREVRARAATTTMTRDVEARLGASRLGSIDSGTPRMRARRMEEGDDDDDDDDEGEADEGRRRDARTPLASALLVVPARAPRSRRLEPRSRRSR